MKRVFTIPRKGMNPGPVLFLWQTGSGNFLVTTGLDQMVNIYDRHGEKQHELSLPGICSGMSWDKEGQILSIICEHSNTLLLWDSNTRTLSHVDSGLRDPMTLIVWSKSAPLLAVGTIKGNLLIYSYRTSKKISILGKHNKQITYGAWSQQNYLALVASDKTFTLSNAEGDTMYRTTLKGEPSQVQFSSMKQDAPGGGETTVSLILNKKALFLLNIHDPEDPIVLSFQEKYGSVIDYYWHDEGYILLGFSSGFFIVLSTLLKEIGQEMCHVQCFKNNLSYMTFCTLEKKVIGCGDDNKVKTYDIKNLQEMLHMITVDDEQFIDGIQWSDDGQLLALAGGEGNLHVYLTKLPVLGSVCGQKLAHLSSLYEVSIYSARKKDNVTKLKIDVEPKFIALGPYHLAVGMNNRAWFYTLGDTGAEFLYDREYLSTVRSLYLNSDYASALIDGKIQLHMIDEPNMPCMERESRIFPDPDQRNTVITCHALTNDFLIFGTDTGMIHLFSLLEWEFCVSTQHPQNTGIKDLHPDFSGTRILIIDSKGAAFVCNPLDSSLLAVPNFSSNVTHLLWNHSTVYKGVFIAFDDAKANIFIYICDSVEGSKVKHLHTFTRNDLYPALLVEEEITFLTPTGKTSAMPIPGHQLDVYGYAQDPNQLDNNFQAAIKLQRFDQAYVLASLMKSEKHWNELAKAALYSLDIEAAYKIFQKLGAGNKVLILEEIKEVEDTKLLAGHIAEFFFKNYELAQSLYLSSSKPSAALEMRKNLFQWDSALKLATTLSPLEVPLISKEYAEQLEFTGDVSAALSNYEKGLQIESSDEYLVRRQKSVCKAGIARTSIRSGDYRRGISLAEEINQPVLYQECASILEEMKVTSDAALLYEKGGFIDNAATLYIKLKNWKKVKELLPGITSPKIYAQYAKAQEGDGNYTEAAQAYENAFEFADAIRIYLENLGDPDSAVRIVKTSNSVEGARMVATFFQRHNDSASAIKFLVISNCLNEALQMAQDTDNMEVYADAIGIDRDPSDFINIAVFYESKRNYLMAGKYFTFAHRYKKAVKLLLDVSGSDEDKAIELAIHAAGQAQDEQITKQLVSHIMGETDGTVKDLQHIYHLYISLGQIKEAARIAVIMASAEQNSGTYKKAKLLLLGMYAKLKEKGMKIPIGMSHSLMLLHSYSLAKLHMQRGDHMKSARMLIRVSNNLNKFPRHDVQILTTTVFECQKAGLNISAHKAAVVLMRPEYRSKLDPKYKRKIENIVRKYQKNEEEELNIPCPYCDVEVPQTSLYCEHCKYNLPYCIITGYHIVRNDIALCPKCQFPGILAEFSRSLTIDKTCPMCLSEISSSELIEVEKVPPENFDKEDVTTPNKNDSHK
ncbi:WD repeat-containing protein 19 [Caerostris darwini]|uniref:WD repeat-containing protein 19 n=1 Tax=Caerostris darwini TaxID=1538125 RepID=A0AAV4S3D4_9ARAC|nr:WD repeat-containing protein 19 [Caerostris darwini]